MKTKNLPAKLLAVIAVIGAVGACAAGFMIPAANAPGLDPVRYSEANATATALAPALYPTVRYNEEVLPTQQAAEAREIVETTTEKYKWERSIDRALALATIIVAGARVTFVSVLALGGCVVILAHSWERAKRARAYVPVQRMPDYAWYIPSERQLGDTRSGAGLLEAPPTSREHTEAVRKFRGVVLRSVVASFFDAVLRRKVSVTEWQPADSREIIVQ